MLNPRISVAVFSVAVTAVNTATVSAQDYPNKPIRIVTSAAGGGTDFAARIIAQGLTAGLGQQVIVDNRVPVVAIQTVMKAPPDGYTVLVGGSTLWIGPLLGAAPYDPVKDFSSVTFSGISPLVLVVHPSLPVKTIKDFVALAKARPGELNYSSGSSGAASHLAPELLKAMAGAKIVRVFYKGNAPALTALLGGEVQLTFGTAPAVVPHIRSGRLRPLAVTSMNPSALAPGLPTVAASGLPGYEVISIDAVFVPANTPATMISRLQQETVRHIHKTEVKQRFLDSGVEVTGTTPDESDKFIRSDIAKWTKLIKDAGIKAD